PVLIWALARLFPRPVHKARPATPTVTIIIAAHNEGRDIAAKLDNCLNLVYPADRLDIVVVCDGSSDGTPNIVAQYARRFPDRITFAAMPRRLGKPNALNTAVALARGEILLLSDVRQRFEPTVARALVANFA